ncbi:MAG: MBL fold metallo-hydrolase [Acidobacteria bacterium]|nr:MBL fold metallo-hydrolase [Acidobacteriota bacterium]
MSVGNVYEQVLSGVGQAFDPSPPPRPRPSGSVVLWRRNAAAEVEVYWVRRSPLLRFMGGWHAFPGGGLAPVDLDTPVQGRPKDVDEPFDPADVPGADDGDLPPTMIDGLSACTLRELFEETGVLVHTVDSKPDRAAVRDARRKLIDQKIGFPGVLHNLETKLDASRLTYAGRWVTPAFSTIRFDARFFLLEWPLDEELQPEVWRGELDHGEWIRPAEAIQRWRRAEALLGQPNLHILRVLLREGPERGLEHLRPGGDEGPAPHRIEFRRDISAIPQRTRTLPPATHTSAYLIGTRELALVDPGSGDADQIERLKRAVQAAAKRDGGIVKAIWLTHHHPDHVGGANAMRQALGVPVCAHPLTAERLESRGIEVDQPLMDGQTIVLAGDPNLTIQVLHTPGHARGHLCFFEEGSRTLIAGDMIAGHSTIIIDPPEGDMDQYLHSLARLIGLQPKTLLPAHGSMLANAVERLQALYNHRLRREQQVLEAWKQGVHDPVEMLASVYADIQAHEYPLAERQIVAHILRLRKLGMI